MFFSLERSQFIYFTAASGDAKSHDHVVKVGGGGGGGPP